MAVVTDQKGTIVVVDDEPNIADLVELYLARDGFRVLKAATGEAGLEAVKDHRPRLVVLDVGLPDIDGLEVCKRIRATSQIPVIFLTARDSEVDRVLGLELGADDYLTKPFSPAELVARVKAVLRRVDGGPAAEVMQAGQVAIDAGRREVRVDGEPVELHDEGVRPAAVPRRAPGPRALPSADPRRRVGLRLVRRRAHGRRAHRAGAQEARRHRRDHDRARRRLPAGVVTPTPGQPA